MPSPKILEKKKEIVKQLSQNFNNAVSGVLVDYRGINVSQDTQLRRELRQYGVNYEVIKNTLTKFAVKGTKLEGLSESLEGPTSLATHGTDIVAPARILVKFIEENNVMRIKVGFIEGQVVSADMVKKIAKLPSKEVLITQVLRGMNAPIAGLANVLNGTLKNFACVISEIAKKKQ